MYNLLVKYDGWASARDSMPQERVFEFTNETIVEQFKPGGKVNTDLITILPALFVSETNGKGDQNALVGSITRAQISTKSVSLEYNIYDAIPAISNSILEQLADELDIDKWEFSRTHWAIKNVDLFKVILSPEVAPLPAPRVFQLAGAEAVDNSLISVMMPFDPRFDEVYSTIQATAKAMNMKCLRADDIWEHDVIIQDVVSLINRSRIIVCDCTGRNANVFYEAGIAHTLGRHVILIAQSEDAIPFDLRHLRYVTYLNNGEGRAYLGERLLVRLQTLLKQGA